MPDEVVIKTTPGGNQASVTIQGQESGVHAPETPVVDKSAERPAWLPAKFKSAEDLAKSYTELEKKLGSGEAKKPAETPVIEKKPDGALQIEANKAVEKAGLDMKALEAEVAAKGDLSPESLQKLEASGISKEQIEVYKRGITAQREDFESKILEGLEGGREQFTEVLKWASQSLSQPEIDSFNKAMEMGDANIGRLAVQGLLSQFQKADGPQLISGQRLGNDQGDVFQSRAQVTAAQSDPRYATDPAYRHQIEKKLLRSDFAKFKH